MIDKPKSLRSLGDSVWDPTLDASDIKFRDVTAEWAGTGVQIIGVVRPPPKDTEADDGNEPRDV